MWTKQQSNHDIINKFSYQAWEKNTKWPFEGFYIEYLQFK